MNVQEFWDQYADEAYELINGEVVAIPEKGELANAVMLNAADELSAQIDDMDTEDIIAGSVGCQLAEDTLLAPDITLLTGEQLEKITDPDRYVPFAPAFVVEVMGEPPDEAAMQARVAHYQHAGTRLIWVIFPAEEKVVTHYADGGSETYTTKNTIGIDRVLKGVRISVKDLFTE